MGFLISDLCLTLDRFYTLRSGGAPGADSMFESSSKRKEIYLPWKGFNGSDSDLFLESMEEKILEKSYSIAKKFHPRWNSLTPAAKKLMCRNTFQILGADLKTPSNFVVCWTPDGKISGGTGQAMRIARNLKIPIYNLHDRKSVDLIRNYVLMDNPLDI